MHGDETSTVATMSDCYSYRQENHESAIYRYHSPILLESDSSDHRQPSRHTIPALALAVPGPTHHRAPEPTLRPALVTRTRRRRERVLARALREVDLGPVVELVVARAGRAEAAPATAATALRG